MLKMIKGSHVPKHELLSLGRDIYSVIDYLKKVGMYKAEQREE